MVGFGEREKRPGTYCSGDDIVGFVGEGLKRWFGSRLLGVGDRSLKMEWEIPSE
jgi:hypothetical protein